MNQQSDLAVKKSRKQVNNHSPSHLEAEISSRIDGYCDFSKAAIAIYASDASNYRQAPIGVVFPRSIQDIIETHACCRMHSVPVLLRGGGTSQNGQCVNHAVVIDCSRYMNRVLSIDVDARTAIVEPGVVCDELKQQAELHGLTFGPDPATHSRCTLGGMIGNNSCGAHSMMAGKTVENVVELEILTSDGTCFWVGETPDSEYDQIIATGDRRSEIYKELKAISDTYAPEIRKRFPTIKRRVSGYNLDQLLPENNFNVAKALVGSEGTCVTVLRAKVRLIENPEHKRLFVLGFNDIFTAGDCVPEILPFAPIAMEGLDWNIVGGLNERGLQQPEVAMLPEGRAWLMVEIAAGTRGELSSLCDKFRTAMQASSSVLSTVEVVATNDTKAFWRIREQGASATSLSIKPDQPDPIVGWEDTAVDPLQLGDYLREFQALVDRYEYTTSLYGHFGDGCIHARITFDTRTENGVRKFRNFSTEIAKLVVKYGGSLSGEHGDGQAKAEFLPIMFGNELMQAFKRFKAAWDPDLRMNPGKLIDAYKMDENLRYGPEYSSSTVSTTLSFFEDTGGFTRSTERCIGMGKCRSQTGAMCPSYKATGEERYSTRGRARLLHEMIRGEIITDGWNNDQIAESLELCLSCKACKSHCPTQVDIASYKSEFMSRYYAGNRRPLQHLALGQINSFLPLLSRFPTVSNFLQRGYSGAIAKKFLGLHKNALLPSLAKQSFSQWVKTTSDSADKIFYWFGAETNPPVVLWPDTVNTFYRPDILKSTLSVLVKAGYRVAIARTSFCCGRPLYDYGMLEQGMQQITRVLTSFYEHLPADARVIVVEPSCLSVFHDELLRLAPDDVRAQELSKRTMNLSAFIHGQGIQPAKKLGRAILHLHCHDSTANTTSYDRKVMFQCFSEVIEPESGCCGMAGTFGLAKRTRDIAQAVFRLNLKPALGESTEGDYIVTNGFSCSSQMSENSNRKVQHPAQIIDMCMD